MNIDRWKYVVTNESTAYSKNMPKESRSYSDEIREYLFSIASLNDELASYAFRMTMISKIGFNPNKQFSTPIGVDFYPLNRSHLLKLLKDPAYFPPMECLPYQSGVQYCGLVKLKHLEVPGAWMKLGTRFGDEDQASEYLSIRDKLFKKEYGTPYYMTSEIGYDSNKKIGKEFGKILRELGYIGVYDFSSATVHENESSQVVALIPKAYETINLYEVSMLRKFGEFDKFHIPYIDRRQYGYDEIDDEEYFDER